jgi:predicted Rossmann fold flavoprotein
MRRDHPRQELATALTRLLPARLAQWIAEAGHKAARIADMPDRHLQAVAELVNKWKVTPRGTEGYRTAEVTLGGVDTVELSSKTFETKSVPGLFFIGEVIDVTGHLGGFNFQWAWSSGFAAGQSV